MIAAFDVYYYANKAKAVGIVFDHWTAQTPTDILVEYITPIADYEPGAFYKRELPCLLALINQLELNNINAIVVDGYVLLDDTGKFGLGAYLYETLQQKIPIIGVAKTKYLQNTQNMCEVFRGQSINPLYVSSIGMDIAQAAQNIQNMFGNYRIPTLLKHLDTLTKKP
ncbi:MAG: endonuclease V [Sphingobacteriales bacterium]|jgi:deoxyribonuclease V|nr:endonuclease V [Sphingobacteriales bacterium]MBP6665396.1 endonuclease V [Chitinophagales bacterium]